MDRLTRYLVSAVVFALLFPWLTAGYGPAMALAEGPPPTPASGLPAKPPGHLADLVQQSAPPALPPPADPAMADARAERNADAVGPDADDTGTTTRHPRRPATRLDSLLARLADEAARRPAAVAAAQAPVASGDRVAVSIQAPAGAPAVRGWLTEHGATIANELDGTIEAYVPVMALVGLAAMPAVQSVRAILPARPAADDAEVALRAQVGAVLSQGVSVHNASAWQAVGYTGAGVKIGIIDSGFSGYAGLVGNELPAPVAVRCYVAVGVYSSGLADCATGSYHGTAVAETVADMAPGATLYLATPISPGDLYNTVAWMNSQGIRVINHSVGWAWDGPGDGTSPYVYSPLASVNLAASGGANWVNAAGNEALRTWTGPYVDADLDWYVDFGPGAADSNNISATAGTPIFIQTRWQDSWYAPTRDVDLYLYYWTGASWVYIAGSASVQSGLSGQAPYEWIFVNAPYTGTYGIRLDRLYNTGGAPGWLQVQTLTGQNLSWYYLGYSTANPAESASSALLAAGASAWSTPSTIESFSSRGPTTDGRVKPDLIGVDRASTVTYGSTFFGTSQSAPHVTGLAALVRQSAPGATPAQIRAYLLSQALPAVPNPNTTWGYGLAHLPSLATLTVVFGGGGGGQVTSNPAAISCPGSCVAVYVAGTVVSLTATAASGSQFSGWAGCDAVNGATCSVTMNAARSVSATFDPSGGPDPEPTKGALTWYFAEGYTGTGFDEYLTIQNPNAGTAAVKITYFLTGKWPKSVTVYVVGQSRDTVVVHETARGVGRGEAVSALVESTNGVGIIVERPMYFRYNGSTTGITDGHNVLGATAPRKDWFFAEGYTGTGFDEYLTIMNPSASAAPVTILYLLSGGDPKTVNVLVPPRERYTVKVHEWEQGVGRNQAVSALVSTTNNDGIVVERPMYFRYTGSMGTITGGNDVVGAPATSQVWRFAEGSTASGFDTYLTVANPNPTDALVGVRYYVVTNGTPQTVDRVFTLAALSRGTVAVRDTANGGLGAGQLFSLEVVTTHTGGIVAERPMFFRYSGSMGTVDGGHTALGATAARPAWYLAEGYTGPGFDEYLVIHNPNATAAGVTITYQLAGGSKAPVLLTVPGLGRSLVAVHGESQGVGRNRAVSAAVTTTHSGGIVVERVMYFLYNGSIDGGHNVVGYAP